MPRDYKNTSIKKTAEKKSPFPFLIGLTIGLICAAAVFFYNDYRKNKSEVMASVSQGEEEIIEVKPEEEPGLLENTAAEATVEEPVYDFYKILPNMEVNVSEWEETEQSATVNEEKPGVYVLQVGSFRKLQAADQVKAKLALLGISADIQRVVINGQDIFHRVRIGPYKTAKKLEEAQSRLLSNDLDFKLLKLTVEDL